jgi:integrase
VDRAAGEIHLRAEASKNRQARTLPMDTELATLIERRWQARMIRQPDGRVLVTDLVFHRAGAPLVDFRKTWASACKAAGVTGKLFHDLRRTAVRNMVRAGVPQSVAQEISGHQTSAVFKRYDITSQDDKRRALQARQAYEATLPAARAVTVLQAPSAQVLP